MRRRGGRNVIAGAALATLVAATGCAADADKAGGEAETVTLTLANGYADLQYVPAVARFVELVEDASGGAMRIEVVNEWGGYRRGYEERLVEATRTGEVELAWVGTRVFDLVGVTGFQALTAPVLIDSYELQDEVVTSDIVDPMLAELKAVDLHGLAVLGGGLRHPWSAAEPLTEPGRWRGITFQTFASGGQTAAVEALGATPTDLVFQELASAIDAGRVAGFEKNLLTVAKNNSQAQLPYVVPNLTLWPETAAIIVNDDRFSALTSTQRGWLEEAASTAATGSTALYADEEQTLVDLCERGARAREATPEQLAEFERAFRPVYAELERDPATRAAINRIRALKETIEAPAGLTAPASCAGAAEVETAADGTDTGGLEGRYRWTLEWEDVTSAPAGNWKTTAVQESEFPYTLTLTLGPGQAWQLHARWSGGEGVDSSGRFHVDAGRLHLEYPAEDSIATFDYVLDEGALVLEADESVPALDEFMFATHPLERIE